MAARRKSAKALAAEPVPLVPQIPYRLRRLCYLCRLCRSRCRGVLQRPVCCVGSESDPPLLLLNAILAGIAIREHDGSCSLEACWRCLRSRS